MKGAFVNDKGIEDGHPAAASPRPANKVAVNGRFDNTPGGPGPDVVPRWLARIGWSGWMVAGTVVGVGAVIVAISVVLPFATPVIFAVVLAAVLQPWVAWLQRHRVHRVAAAVIATLAVPAVVSALVVVVVVGLRGQSAVWAQTVETAAESLRSGTGVDPLTPVVDASQRQEVLLGLAGGVLSGAAAFAALVFTVLIALYVLFFLLLDGPRFGAGIAGRLSLPADTVRLMVADGGVRLRRYVVGTTVVAALDAVVIGGAAVVLRLPLVLVIVLVTFATAYVPYLGAWISAIFTVMVALGAGGVDTALWMLAVVLVTQNLLEGVVRPVAFGAALDMHPLAILAATVAGGILGGVVGVFIAPPLAAIVVSWLRTLRGQRQATRVADDAGGSLGIAKA
ncbi:AI-2E family transporter [Actinoplanes sp. CA-051413]|uniref:AI-2E family transporter n=1 Tax=Actinoplanes sp. CA-051413 TaxID=3239899 RepID=UPI003D999D4E